MIVIEKYLNFVRGVSAGRIGKAGVVLTTSSVILFVIMELARLAGIVTNAYMGLITYLVFPVMFLVGLVLIPIGWRIRKKRTGRTGRELLVERFEEDSVRSSFLGSRLVRTIGIFTIANVVILGAASVRMLEFMDTPVFCGTACHSVMGPEWATYQKSPHARVRCIDCHVGEGVDAVIASKLNGTWQIISLTFDLLERPIPTPVHQLRPARETCEKCHWPDKFYGSRLKTIYHYALDEASTPEYTTLNIKVDAGSGGERGGIHWHIAENNEVRYVSVDDMREEMIWVEVLQPDSSFKRFRNRRLSRQIETEGEPRAVDCVDCHNRATHIYEEPERAVDDRIRQGLMDRGLPWLKREALAAILANYPGREAGLDGIANRLRSFYEHNYSDLAGARGPAIDSAIAAMQAVYERNIHTEMNIKWGTYGSHIGHIGETGCFRCHNSKMVAEDGTTISYGCTTCHSILANRDVTPFEYLEPVKASDRNYPVHQYLQQEFLHSYTGAADTAAGDE